MVKIHKEGKNFIILVFAILILFNLILYSPIILIISLAILLFVVSFFRNPQRICKKNDELVYAPADGKIVVIEETNESEYLKEKRIQISIFMSVWNVHVNWFPISGIIKYFKYHPGKYLVAWHPKSSTENEHNTIVIETESKTQILIRQIAGAIARRIISYASANGVAIQGNHLGFIKFGSRVDLFLPLNAELKIKINQKVKGNKTVIAKLN